MYGIGKPNKNKMQFPRAHITQLLHVSSGLKAFQGIAHIQAI